jgi:hypothetical protein
LANVKHSSGTVEHFTPPNIVIAAQQLMTGRKRIDLDPATTKWGNEQYVQAKRIYTKKDNGFLKKWRAKTVFLNPPGGLCDDRGRLVIRTPMGEPPCSETGACGTRAPHVHEGTMSSGKAWWFKLAEAYMRGHVRQAVFVGFSLELLQTTQVQTPDLPVPLDFPCCYPTQRIKFHVKRGRKLFEGGSPTHANVIVYLPDEWTSHLERDPSERFHRFFHEIGRVVWPSTKVRRLK